jgi:hypothetical protein
MQVQLTILGCMQNQRICCMLESAFRHHGRPAKPTNGSACQSTGDLVNTTIEKINETGCKADMCMSFDQ